MAAKKKAAKKTNSVMSKMLAKSDETKRQQVGGNKPGLGVVAELAERQIKIEDEITIIETELKAKRAELEDIATKRLPQEMSQLGIEEITLTDGSKVSISTFYSASIPKDQEDEAFKWLRENGFESLIQTQIQVNFGKGEDSKAKKLKKLIQQVKDAYDEKTGVHSSTLKAFIKEQIESGSKVPMQLFGAFVGRKAKIKRAAV